MPLFDKGWNALREQIFANQKRLGVIPQDAQLTTWPDGQAEFGGAKLAKWDTLSDDEKKMFIRQANVYAAYLACLYLLIAAAANFSVSRKWLWHIGGSEWPVFWALCCAVVGCSGSR